MITVQPESKIFRSADFKENKFNIQASAKAFDILSSKLYADKYSAIVRELSTNASDAHIAAGKKDVPIKVFCPTILNPVFSVEDFGTGIDPEKFEDIYTTYFYSTKTTTNDQVGCFGLGSKSPFAYTDQFTVENSYGGYKYVYSCYKDSSGQPSVALLSKSPVDKTGIKIFFPVIQFDFNHFTDAIRRILPWFDVKPESNIHFDHCVQDQSAMMSSHKEAYGFGLRRGIYIRMGQVVYPAPADSFRDIFVSFPSKTIVINAPVGSIDITPSRESIEITDHTKKGIKELHEKLKDYILWKLENDNESLTKFMIGKKNNNFINYFCLNREFALKMNLSSDFCIFDPYKTNFRPYTLGNSRSKAKKTTATWMHYDDEVFINDIKRGVQSRITEYLVNNPSVKIAFVFSPEDKDKLTDPLYGFEESDIKLVSSLAKPLPKPSASRQKTNCTFIKIDNVTTYRCGDYLPKTTLEGFYLKDWECARIRMQKLGLFEELKKNGVFVFTDNQFKTLKISSRNFTHLYDFLKTHIQNPGDVYYRAAYIYSNQLRKRKTDILLALADKVKNSPEFKNFLGQYDYRSIDEQKLSLINTAKEMMRSLDSQPVAADILSIDQKIDLVSSRFDSLVGEIYKKYPLLKILISDSVELSVIDDVVDYINLVDEKGIKS